MIKITKIVEVNIETSETGTTSSDVISAKYDDMVTDYIQDALGNLYRSDDNMTDIIMHVTTTNTTVEEK